VVVGLPPGSRHELGALAFATALRRIGHHVLYLGADVPTASWQTAVQSHSARAAVVAVATASDRPEASGVAALLRAVDKQLLIASGGPAGDHRSRGAHTLPSSIAAAALALDGWLHGEPLPH
jgi:MerR family transcriptional regulator, light-induced transcriptional regulator